jgi:DNA-binding transcriptional LysR family regulator
MDLLAAYRIFVRVTEVGSFSAVAREAGMTQPAVSRQISVLETHFGARLIQRSTRHLALTEDGESLLLHARRALEAVDEAEAAIGKRRLLPSGRVHLACPTGFGRLHIAPRIPRLLNRYPELCVDLIMSDHPADMISAGVDVWIRGAIADTSLVAHHIGSTQLALVASEEYLATHGEPVHPTDLARHECLVNTEAAAPVNEWQFGRAQSTVTVRVGGRLRGNSSEAIRIGVLGSLGVGQLPAWYFLDELRSGQVREVLHSWRPPPTPINVVYPSRRNLAARTRVVIDFFVEEFRHEPALSEGDG